MDNLQKKKGSLDDDTYHLYLESGKHCPQASWLMGQDSQRKLFGFHDVWLQVER